MSWSRPRACATAPAALPTLPRSWAWRATSSSPRIRSSTRWSARTPTAISSAATARPESAARASGIGPVTTARRSDLPPRWTPPRSQPIRPEIDGDSDMQMIALFFLVTASIGGVTWVFVYPLLSGERKAEKRQETVTRAGTPARAAAQRGGNLKSRSEQVAGRLQEIEKRRTKAKSPPLSVRIAQAGLSWSKRKFLIISGVLGLVGFLVALGLNAGLLGAAGMAFAGAFGLPMWILKFLKK